MKRSAWVVGVAAALAGGGGLWAQEQVPAVVAPGEEKSTVVPSEAALSSLPEWKGVLRVLWNEDGTPRALRLITADRLYAVETNAVAVSWAKKGDRREVRLLGKAELRDGRTWLVPDSFSLPEDEVARPSEPTAATSLPAEASSSASTSPPPAVPAAPAAP